MCHTSTTESGPKGIGDLSCALGLLVQGRPKTSGLKHHSSLPSASPSIHANFLSRPASTRSPSFPPSFPFPPPKDTSATSTSSSRSTVLSTTNLATSTTSNGPPLVTSNLIHPFTLTTSSPLPSTKTVFFIKTVTEPPVTRTRNVVITSLATTTATLHSTRIKSFTERITDTTTLTLTPTTVVKPITYKETETATITQTGTVTPTATSKDAQSCQYDSFSGRYLEYRASNAGPYRSARPSVPMPISATQKKRGF
ncbi:hypothetical protein EDD85DRAFT_365544 [Armillaria nabsnona]|nr:hypothetical protein EDD85DRAFT_365544 [Armillaria nabsnona]